MSERVSYEEQTYAEIMEQFKEPSMYAVVIYNDDYTTMDFVVELLVKVFHKTLADAVGLMLEVHESGKGTAGIYTFDIAATKRLVAVQMAVEQGFPLKVLVEEAH